MPNGAALLIIDVQKDFCPGGALPVPEGDRIIPFLNSYIRLFRKYALPIFATRDWHPLHTLHFREDGGVWPRHCVQESDGARFHPGLELPPEVTILSKGMKTGEDGYSGFLAVTPNGETFQELVESRGVVRLYVGGLATDYCVRQTVLDALHRGYAVTLLEEAIRGIDAVSGDSARAVADMLTAGAESTTIEKLSSSLKNQ
ncbi:isochorismatase family protein [Geobacter sp. DSM 9736]|uniref:isochorismatase family protein n=1 Tax=Geobacter sp. DSM 9736 TaxID=1277350 RepID=UPI000B513EEC|nr:isochorismatase family protein [Geobacter sp. DSM 9736]SNB44989.1 nicotinamidase/pyrazinamidase [Geobacter sp. DSM 9736]